MLLLKCHRSLETLMSPLHGPDSLARPPAHFCALQVLLHKDHPYS